GATKGGEKFREGGPQKEGGGGGKNVKWCLKRKPDHPDKRKQKGHPKNRQYCINKYCFQSPFPIRAYNLRHQTTSRRRITAMKNRHINSAISNINQEAAAPSPKSNRTNDIR